MDISDEEEQAAAKERFALIEEEDKEYVRQVVNTYAGRAFVWRLICMSGVYRAPVSHPIDTHREVGKQDLGRDIQEIIWTTDPNSYTLMRQECEKRDRMRENTNA